jgi:hypothetical protein
MDAPTAAVPAPIHGAQKTVPILKKLKIIGYFRYVDDILIIYNQNKRNVDETLTEFNE